MSAIAHFTAFLLTAIAALFTLTAIAAATQNTSISTPSRLLLFGSLLLALATGTSITAVLGLYLANIILISSLLFTYVLLKRTGRQGTRTQYTAEPSPDDPAEEPVIWNDQ